MNISKFNELYLKFKNENKQECLFILESLSNTMPENKNAIHDIVSIYKRILALEENESIKEGLLELLNSKLNTFTGYEILQFKVLTDNDEKAKEIVFYEMEVDQEETEEKVEKLEKMIKDYEEIGGKSEYISKFKKRVKQLRKRLDRTIPEEFGQMIKFIRDEKGLSLQELADLSGVSTSYIHKLERGEKRTPSYPIIKKIADVLGIDLSATLIKGKEKPVDIQSLIINNTIEINGKPIKPESKNKLIKIINFINECKWQENKINEMYELSVLVEDYKNSFK